MSESETEDAPTVSFQQTLRLGKAVFPLVDGEYLECDSGPNGVGGCPFDTRLKTQLATYAANARRLCPQGCGGGMLLLRQRCGGFPHQTVSTPQNPAIGVVMLTGNACLGGGGAETMYISVVLEDGTPLVDDVMCNAGDPKYGMYSTDANATGGNPCAPFS